MDDDVYVRQVEEYEDEVRKLKKKYKDMERLFMTLVYSLPSHRAVIDQVDVVILKDSSELVWLYDPAKRQYHFMVVRKG